MDQTHRMSLPYLLPGQAQKHVTLNKTLERLDTVISLQIASRQTAIEPPSPAEQDVYLLPPSPVGGQWSAFATGDLVQFTNGVWAPLSVPEGQRAWVADEQCLIVRAPNGWIDIDQDNLPAFGVNTPADVSNRLSVKSDAVLFSHDDVSPGTGDMRHQINRSTVTGTASVLFQTAHSGGAEMGLTTSPDLTLKTSPDGTIFNTGLILSAATGAVDFPAGFTNPLALLGAVGLRHDLGTITDDSTAEIDFGTSVFGAALLVIPNALSSGPAAFFYARMASTPTLDTLFAQGHAHTAQTGPMSGTTGPDGGVNFSATSDGKFVIENRRGYGLTYRVYVFK